jgi:hypothetical protein
MYVIHGIRLLQLTVKSDVGAICLVYVVPVNVIDAQLHELGAKLEVSIFPHVIWSCIATILIVVQAVHVYQLP